MRRIKTMLLASALTLGTLSAVAATPVVFANCPGLPQAGCKDIRPINQNAVAFDAILAALRVALGLP